MKNYDEPLKSHETLHDSSSYTCTCIPATCESCRIQGKQACTRVNQQMFTWKPKTLKTSLAQMHTLASPFHRKPNVFHGSCTYARAEIRCASGVFTTSLISPHVPTLLLHFWRRISVFGAWTLDRWSHAAHKLCGLQGAAERHTKINKRMTCRQESKCLTSCK